MTYGLDGWPKGALTATSGLAFGTMGMVVGGIDAAISSKSAKEIPFAVEQPFSLLQAFACHKK